MDFYYFSAACGARSHLVYVGNVVHNHSAKDATLPV